MSKVQMGPLASFDIYFLSVFIIRKPLTSTKPVLLATLSKNLQTLLLIKLGCQNRERRLIKTSVIFC